MSTATTKPKYPEVTAIITDGNAFAIMGAVQKALRRAGVPKEELDAYFTESTSGDYENLIAVAESWVNTEWN